MAKRDYRETYFMTVPLEAGFIKHELRYPDIEHIAARSDFPRWLDMAGIDTRSNDIKLSRGKAERLIALILRDEKKMLSDEANTLASAICNRLQAAMAMPTKPGLRGQRMISSSPPGYFGDDDYVDAVRNVVDVDAKQARRLWEVVYSFGRDLPDDVVV
jgi:hypothetical protein